MNSLFTGSQLALLSGTPGNPCIPGAVADGTTLNTKAFQSAIDALAATGGGTLRIGAGTWLTGSLFLKDDIRLELDPGCILAASTDPADFPLIPTRWEGRTREAHAALIHARSAKNCAITGSGTIDGRGDAWWLRHREGSLDAPRPRLIALEDCERVMLRDFHAVNSPSWTINPVRCRDVLISGLRIDNPPDSPNTDGINPDSSSMVTIHACRISVGDDCIAIKAGTEAEDPRLAAPCERIIISDCILERGHGAIVLGSEMSGGIRDVLVSNCVFSGTDRGFRFKTRRGRGGVIERIRATNIIMNAVRVPVAINMHYVCGARGNPRVATRERVPEAPDTPVIRDISMSHITATGVGIACCHIEGLAESPVRNLSFSDLDLRAGGNLSPEEPEMSESLRPRARSGFIITCAEGLSLDRVRISGQDGHPFELNSCTQVTFTGCGPEVQLPAPAPVSRP